MSHEFLNSRSSRVSSILGLGFEIKFNPLNQTQMSEKEIALLFYLLFFWQWKCFIALQIKQGYCKRARERFFYSCDYRSINMNSPKTQGENSDYIQRTLVLVSNPRDIGFAWSCGRWKFKTAAKHYFSCRACLMSPHFGWFLCCVQAGKSLSWSMLYSVPITPYLLRVFWGHFDPHSILTRWFYNFSHPPLTTQVLCNFLFLNLLQPSFLFNP